MSACEMGALCCKSSPCAYWAVDGNAEEVAALRAEVEQAHSYLARLLQNTHPQWWRRLGTVRLPLVKGEAPR